MRAMTLAGVIVRLRNTMREVTCRPRSVVTSVVAMDSAKRHGRICVTIS